MHPAGGYRGESNPSDLLRLLRGLLCRARSPVVFPSMRNISFGFNNIDDVIQLNSYPIMGCL